MATGGVLLNVAELFIPSALVSEPGMVAHMVIPVSPGFTKLAILSFLQHLW